MRIEKGGQSAPQHRVSVHRRASSKHVLCCNPSRAVKQSAPSRCAAFSFFPTSDRPFSATRVEPSSRCSHLVLYFQIQASFGAMRATLYSAQRAAPRTQVDEILVPWAANAAFFVEY